MNNNEKTVKTYVLPDLSKYEDKRTVIYTRVSSRKNVSEESLVTQEEKLVDYIKSHPDLKYIKTYTDNGITGTIANRPGFQAMMEDCRAHQIDLIITKSITRFARNTTLTLQCLRELKELGVDVYFHKEKVHSISDEGELLITLLSTFAEAESQSASLNKRWRIKLDFEQGIPSPTRVLGYDMIDRSFVINPDEAKIVKRIFKEYIRGKGFFAIAKELNNEGVKPLNGGVWFPSTIEGMIHNEIYTGDLLLQKTYRESYLTKKSKINHGEVGQYYVKDDHQPIIDRESFNAAQEIAKQRSGDIAHPTGKKPGYLYTGMIFCGVCGKRLTRKKTHGIVYWSCQTYQYMGKDACHISKIPEYAITDQVKQILGKDEICREDILENFERIVVPENHELLFIEKSGKATYATWKHKSRSESWTDEMKATARMRSLELLKEVEPCLAR